MVRLILLLIPLVMFSQFRKYSNEFLNIGVDARAFAMGNAVVASQADVNSSYWNPAGLTEVFGDYQFSAMHAEYFESIAAYDFIAAAIPFRNNTTLGISLMRFGVDDILNTTELIDNQGNIDYNNISSFTTADYAATISFAGKFFKDQSLSAGINAKFIYRNIGKFATGYGFGLDIGFRYEAYNDFYFGLMVRDITTTFNVWSINEEKLPEFTVEGETLNTPTEDNLELTYPKLKAGAAKRFEIGEYFTAMPELDLEFNFGPQQNNLISVEGLSLAPSGGVEVGYSEVVYFRAGFNNIQKETDFVGKSRFTIQPNIGVGVKFRGISLDYALTDVGDNSIALYSNIVSVKLDLGEWR